MYFELHASNLVPGAVWCQVLWLAVVSVEIKMNEVKESEVELYCESCKHVYPLSCWRLCGVVIALGSCKLLQLLEEMYWSQN